MSGYGLARELVRFSCKSSNVTRGEKTDTDSIEVTAVDFRQCRISAKNSNRNRRVLATCQSR